MVPGLWKFGKGALGEVSPELAPDIGGELWPLLGPWCEFIESGPAVFPVDPA